MSRRPVRIVAGGLAVLVPLALISLSSVHADDSDGAVPAATQAAPWPPSWLPLDAQSADAKDDSVRVGDAAAGCFATQRRIPIGDEARM